LRALWLLHDIGEIGIAEAGFLLSSSTDRKVQRLMPVLKAPIHLYWVTTKDNDEDWFIFARSARTAAKLS
jgi:hypothetical protein